MQPYVPGGLVVRRRGRVSIPRLGEQIVLTICCFVFFLYILAKAWWCQNVHRPGIEPGNRTRVTRMGILYDTTTPAVPVWHTL